MHYCKFLFPVVTLVCCCAGLLDPTKAAAESFKAQQWDVTADKLTRYEKPASIIAEGNVVLIKTEKIPKAHEDGKENNAGWGDLLGSDAAAPASGGIKKHGEKKADAGKKAAAEDTVSQSKSMPEIKEDAAAPGAPSAAAPSQNDGNALTEAKVMTTIKADWMVYDLDLGTVKLRGHVFIEIGPDQLTATAGTVNLNRETGTFENASIIRQYKDLHLEGRVVEKTGELTYHIEDGWIITCKLQDGQVPPWSFHAADADITDGGYAFLKHATFHIKDVPILYTPIMILPAKRSRQTGFLFPLASFSDRNGFGLETPFFIDLSPSSDITLYPYYMANRGIMTGAEMRYMLEQGAKGSVMGNFLADKLSDPADPANADYYKETGYAHTNQERYWMRGKADQNIGDWTTRLDFDVVSDRDYLTEFDVGRTGLTVSDQYFLQQFGRSFQDKTIDQRSNQLSTLRSWNNGSSLQATLYGVNDVREGTDKNSLWKLPEAKYSGLRPIYDTGINFAWDTNYVNYWREKGVGAQRIDLYPRLKAAVPLMQQYLETTVGGGIRDTMYAIDDNGDTQWQDSDTENRLLGEIETEVATTMKKDISTGSGEADYWSHAVRPFVQYKFVTDADQEKLPQFDDVDSYGDQNKITYGVNNFFYVGEQKDKEATEREYGYVKVQQSYDVRSNAGDEPLSAVEARTAWYPMENLAFKYETDVSVYNDGFLKHLGEGNYTSSRGDTFSANYLFYKNTAGGTDTNSVRLSTLIQLMYDFSAGYSLEKSLENSVTVEEKVRLIYHPTCWSVELAAETTPDNEQFTIMFQLANIGSPFGMDFMGR